MSGGDLKLAQLREIVGLCRALGLKWSEALAEYEREGSRGGRMTRDGSANGRMPVATESDRDAAEDRAVTVCAHCGRSMWLAECCGSPVVSPTIHVHRESPLRPGSFRLLCRASMREEWHVGEDSGQATCLVCIAVIDREAACAA